MPVSGRRSTTTARLGNDTGVRPIAVPARSRRPRSTRQDHHLDETKRESCSEHPQQVRWVSSFGSSAGWDCSACSSNTNAWFTPSRPICAARPSRSPRRPPGRGDHSCGGQPGEHRCQLRRLVLRRRSGREVLGSLTPRLSWKRHADRRAGSTSSPASSHPDALIRPYRRNSTYWYPITSGNSGVPGCRGLWSALLAVEIHVDEALSLGVAGGPLEVVQERPPGSREPGAFGDCPLDRPEAPAGHVALPRSAA